MIIPVQIENPNFTDGFYNYEGIGELTIARGWIPWWEQGTPEQVAEGYFKRPEFKPEPNRVLIGNRGQKFFTTFATHNAGLWQRVKIPMSGALVLTAKVQFWSHHTDGTGGGYACCVGIDRTGENNWREAEWGEWHGQYDPDGWDGSSWRQVSVETQVGPGDVTIFLRGACLYRAKHNDSYWDAISLILEVEDQDLIHRLRRIGHEILEIADKLES